MRLLGKLFPWLWLGALLWLTWCTRTWNSADVFVGDGVYFIDADCYSRMTRVKQVIEHPLRSIRHHDFENFPEGTDPHTTAPMDWAIAALSAILDCGPDIPRGASALGEAEDPSPEGRREFRTSAEKSHPMPLDLAGAWISPLLAMALVGFLWWWSRRLELPFRNALLLIVIFSPILTHGFLLGRPDHQSLELLLLGVALAAEFALWRRASRGWSILSGLAWGLALWTSLFEPPILLLLVLILRFAFFRKEAFAAVWRPGYLVFAAVCAVALLFDGWRIRPLDPKVYELFPRWSTDIGELNRISFSALFSWTGWLLVPVPFLLLWRALRGKSREAVLSLALLLVTCGLTLWQQRWGYFAVMIFALSLPWALPAIPWKPLAWTAFVFAAWPAAREWDQTLFPPAHVQSAREENREDAALLRAVAVELKDARSGAILAPWWLSPPLAYWSGLPCVAGSSHQSLPGIGDSVQFYLASDGDTARDILARRNVRYVVAYEPSRILSNSQKILKQPATRKSLGYVLYETPFPTPEGLQPFFENKYFKVFEVVSEGR